MLGSVKTEWSGSTMLKWDGPMMLIWGGPMMPMWDGVVPSKVCLGEIYSSKAN
jgi:hypothetical protein